MKIYLARHGQTTGDLEDRYGGDYDDHLTDHGRKQAKELSEKLKDKGVEHIFASPRIRAQQTAEIVKEVVDCEIETIEEIKENGRYGVLTGMTKKEAREKYPEQVALLKDRYSTVEEGESYKDFGTRLMRAYKHILTSGYKTVAVIAHGGPIRYLFREQLKMGEFAELGDCALFELDFNGFEIKLTKMECAQLENK